MCTKDGEQQLQKDDEHYNLRNPTNFYCEGKAHKLRVIHRSIRCDRGINEQNKGKECKKSKNRKNDDIVDNSGASKTIGNTEHSNFNNHIHENKPCAKASNPTPPSLPVKATRPHQESFQATMGTRQQQ
jgi:hypothetical protein